MLINLIWFMASIYIVILGIRNNKWYGFSDDVLYHTVTDFTPNMHITASAA